MSVSWSRADARRALGFLGDGAVTRGTAYARRGMIVDARWTSPTVLAGTCRGSGGRVYAVTVTLRMAEDKIADVFGVCSCPVGGDCKHCAALILHASTTVDHSGSRPSRTAASPDPPAATGDAPWRSLLKEMAQSGPPPPSLPAVPMLRYGLRAVVRGNPPGGKTVFLRPVARTGDAEPWREDLVGWADLGRLELGDPGDTGGTELIRVARALDRADPAALRHSPSRSPQWAALTGASSAFWKALRSATAAGLPLVPTAGRTQPERIEFTDDLAVAHRVSESGDGLTLSAHLMRGQVPCAPGAPMLLGTPVTGAAVPEGDVLWLGSLTTPSPLEKRMLDGETLTIGPDDVPEFLAALPELRAQRTVELPATGLAVPDVSAPFPLLRVEFDGTGTRLQWRTGYRVGERVRDFPATVPDAPSGFRDPAAEAAVWQAVRPELELVAAANIRWRNAAVAELTRRLQRVRYGPDAASVDHSLRELARARTPQDAAASADVSLLTVPVGMNPADTAVFCGELIGRITAAGIIEIEQIGDPPDFRRARETTLEFSGTPESGGAGGPKAQSQYSWLGLDIVYQVDDHRVPITEIIAHLAAGERFMVLGDGTYFSLESPSLRRLKDLLDEAQAMGEIGDRSVPGAQPNVTLWDELLGLGVIDEQLAQWRERMAMLAAARPPQPVVVPAALDATLREYQRDGLDWLSFLWDNGLGGILADDMGLGKTVQTLALLTRVCQADPGARFLVVAPTSVIGNWAAESARFSPSLGVAAITSTSRRAGTTLAEQIGAANIVITSYALLRIDYDEFAAQDWSGLILDEAQFIKNHNSKTHQAARRLPTGFKLAITGTPMENNVMELWSLVSVVAPGLYSSPQLFRQHFAKPIESGDPTRLDTLRRRLTPIMLRRTKEQVAGDLPPKQESIVPVELDGKHRKIYDTFLARERQKVLGLLHDWDGNRVEILAALTRMRQLSLHPGLVDDRHAGMSSNKIEYLAQRLPILLEEGHNALVFSSFAGFLRLIADSLTGAGIGFSYLDGSMTATDRETQIASFTSGATRVFLISLKAGGFGLNLTAADYCFVADPWWNPAAEAQAVDRAHRIGQQRPVNVYRLVATGTIEEKVVALQQRKRELFDALIDEGGQFRGGITADDVRRLVTDD